MIRKLQASVLKEFRLLIRDKAGLGILFVMPIILIIIMSLLQDSGFKTINGHGSVDVLFIDNDQDTLGARIRRGLESSSNFRVTTSSEGKKVTQLEVNQLVLSGQYTIGVVIPNDMTRKIRAHVGRMVAQTLSGFAMIDLRLIITQPLVSDTISVCFDPAVRPAFREGMMNALRLYQMQIQNEMVFSIFQREMAKLFPGYKPTDTMINNAVVFREIYPGYKAEVAYPDTAQHNVPAWTVFAMFFIIIPFTSVMIAERQEGSMIRLMTLPAPYPLILASRVLVYTMVCFSQALLMVLTGIFILPLLGILPLEMGNQYIAMVLMTLMTSLAALGFGVAVGTVATTHQQAAAFGSISVVIMAATGGLWVPVYLMASAMQQVAGWSPMNWALNGYYEIFIRQGGLGTITDELFKLGVFSVSAFLFTMIYKKMNNPLNR
jgi:ABC-2 type transport system permease protein